MYQRKCSALPAFPATLTEATAWSVLRRAWRDDRYWLSVAELQLVGTWNGPEVEVYQQRVGDTGADTFQLLPRDQLPPLEAPELCERIVLSVDAEQHCGCHFSKLLTAAAWANWAARAAQAEEASSGSEAGGGSEGDNEEEDSTSSEEDNENAETEEEPPTPPRQRFEPRSTSFL